MCKVITRHNSKSLDITLNIKIFNVLDFHLKYDSENEEFLKRM